MVLLFYATYISVDRAHHAIFRAKVGKGGINVSSKVPGESSAQTRLSLHCSLMR